MLYVEAKKEEKVVVVVVEQQMCVWVERVHFVFCLRLMYTFLNPSTKSSEHLARLWKFNSA